LHSRLAVAALIGIVLLAAGVPYATAQETRESSYSLKNFDVSISYPVQSQPGTTVVLSARATAKSSIYVVELRVQVMYYSSGGALVPVASELLSSNTRVQRGTLIQREISIAIPSDIPRGELVGFFTERVRYAVYTYSYYVYNYSYYYWYYYGYPYYYAYSGYTYESTDAAILPLTYVLSTTPEYEALKVQYDDLNARYNELAQQFEQLKADNQQNVAKLNEVSQLQQSTALTLEGAKNTITLLSIISVVLGIATVALFALYLREKQRKPSESS
jgi:hypothetical protein